MPASYEIDTDLGIVRATVLGEITLAEERACFESFLADPDHRPGFGILLDNRKRGTPASADHMRGMAQALAWLKSGRETT
jgi:hypothetical protein